MHRNREIQRGGFTLVEVMIVAGIIGLIAVIAIPAYAKARDRSYASTCQKNRRIIFEALNVYCMDHCVDLNATTFPDLCASRDTLAPGGSSDYVRDWDAFECSVADTQVQHDYAYVWDNGILMDIQCNNSNTDVRDLHNQD